MDKRKLAVAYIFLVGFPLLTLVAILRAGTHLTAPMAVHGIWNVQADFSPWQGVPCGASLTPKEPPLLTIVQSGKDLTATLNDSEKAVLTGTIDGPILSITSSHGGKETSPAPKPDPGCPGPQSLRLQATVNQQGNQRSLTGTFQLEGCASCSPIAFSATRQMPEGRNIP